MCVKLSPGDLNPGPYPLHFTNIYTCRVTTTLRVRSGNSNLSLDIWIIHHLGSLLINVKIQMFITDKWVKIIMIRAI